MLFQAVDISSIHHSDQLKLERGGFDTFILPTNKAWYVQDGIVLANRASGHLLYTPTLKNHYSAHPKLHVRDF